MECEQCDHYVFYVFRSQKFQPGIGLWNVSKVRNMASMFHGATVLNQDLGGWVIRNVTSVTNMFSEAILSTANYDATLSGWSTLNLTHRLTFDNFTYCINGSSSNTSQ